MLRSMTAYGRAHHTTSVGRFVVEIQSVNRKFLEINLSLPSEFLRFEPDLRRLISAATSRGQIYLKLTVAYESKSPLHIAANLPLARQIQSACKELAAAAGLPSSEELTVRMLASQERILVCEQEEDQEEYLPIIQEAVNQALEQFIQMKNFEGKLLQKDLQDRLLLIRQAMQEVVVRAPDAVERYRSKLKERLEELLPGSVENEERILREIAIYAEKCDIAEEITRFQSHLQQIDKILTSSETGVGKTLEFLLQELTREINTIASKSADTVVASCAVTIKSEIERIREQVQNVE